MHSSNRLTLEIFALALAVVLKSKTCRINIFGVAASFHDSSDMFDMRADDLKDHI